MDRSKEDSTTQSGRDRECHCENVEQVGHCETATDQAENLPKGPRQESKVEAIGKSAGRAGACNIDAPLTDVTWFGGNDGYP